MAKKAKKAKQKAAKAALKKSKRPAKAPKSTAPDWMPGSGAPSSEGQGTDLTSRGSDRR